MIYSVFFIDYRYKNFEFVTDTKEREKLRSKAIKYILNLNNTCFTPVGDPKLK